MKKILFLGVLFTLAFSLAACDFGSDDPDPVCTADQTLVAGVCEDNVVADTTAPVLTGVIDEIIYVDETFNNLNGVSSIDDIDGDITAEIIITGTVDVTTTGQYYLIYSSTDAAGNISEDSRYITVEIDPSLLEEEMVSNGDFALGATIWNLNTGSIEGGSGTFSVVDGVGVVDVVTPTWSILGPRLESNTMTFENGKTYEISFKAKADDARLIGIQVGELLTVGPWFIDYMLDNYQTFSLTTEMQVFSFKVTMTEDTNNNVQILFNMGTVTDDAGTLITNVYFDDVLVVESTPDPDTTGPNFSGIDDVVILTDSTFDPLEGVTAKDIIDGDITLTVANVTGTVDTAVEDDYILTYTVSDVAGNATIETRLVTVVGLVFNPTSAIVDGTFTTTTTIIAEVQNESNEDITDEDIWYSWYSDLEGAAAVYTVTDGLLNINITAPGSSDWDLQFKQKGLELTKGQTYKLVFDASATADRDIIAKVTSDYSIIVNLTSTTQTFELMFTYEGETITNGELMFMLGNTALYAAGVITLDNIELLEFADGIAVMNPKFEDLGWSTLSKDALFWDEDPEVLLINNTAEIVDGEYIVTYDGIGQNAWEMQLFQEGFDSVAGATYRITFDAYADVARSINVVVICGGIEYRGIKSLTNTKATFTYNFVADPACDNGKLDFEFANVLGTETPGWVAFDNIMFEDYDKVAVVEGTDQVVNGAFEEVLYWAVYSHDSGSSIAIVDDMLVVTVASLGENPWDVQLYQADVPMFVGGTYTVMFDAKSDVARSINAKLISNVEDAEVFELTTEMATYSYTFEYSGNTVTAKLDFELGLIESAVAGTVTFDNVIVYRNFNDQN